MIINRHNYEECFILYWDNELTASQKQAVENFVKENQDLEEEFNILGQTRFVPDNNIQLQEKELLIKEKKLKDLLANIPLLNRNWLCFKKQNFTLKQKLFSRTNQFYTEEKK